jgi:hypothetical protein
MKNYTTKDLYIASFLYAKGLNFIGLHQEGKVYSFLFEDIEACNKLVLLQWQGKAEVNARAFIEAIKTLKNLIFQR